MRRQSTLHRALQAWSSSPCRLLIVVVLLLGGSVGGLFAADESPRAQAAFTRLNREIVVFRSQATQFAPAERVKEAGRRLRRAGHALIEPGITTRKITVGQEQGVRFSAGDNYLFTLLESDLDQLAGESLDDVAKLTLARVDSVLETRDQMLQPAYILRATGIVIGVTCLLAALLWLLRRGGRWVSGKIGARIERVSRLRFERADLRPHLMVLLKRLVGLFVAAVMLTTIYLWLTFSLQQFPATIGWGEGLGDNLKDLGGYFWDAVIGALPGLGIVAVILIIARWLGRLVNYLITGLESDPEGGGFMSFDTARATRRIVVAFIWLFAIVMAYPYLPGSGSVAFQGVSVLFGLMVSLGSTGMVNQIMSGFVMLYSGSIRTGEYVKVGSIEGTVSEMGLLATRVMTPRRDFISVPNAVLVSNPTHNYSRLAAEYGAVTTTAVTIGYDTPWRQVHAMLKNAAERTTGIRKDPEPRILQTGLLDHYVEYTLVFCVEKPGDRPAVLSRLHQEIQDSFNEYEVQIMSPHFRAQPEEAIIVPKSHWFEKPAPGPEQDSMATR